MTAPSNEDDPAAGRCPDWRIGRLLAPAGAHRSQYQWVLKAALMMTPRVHVLVDTARSRLYPARQPQ